MLIQDTWQLLIVISNPLENSLQTMIYTYTELWHKTAESHPQKCSSNYYFLYTNPYFGQVKWKSLDLDYALTPHY